MRKLGLIFLLAVVVVNSVFSFPVSSEEMEVIKVRMNEGAIEISIDEKNVEFHNEPYIDDNGRTQVPVRELCEYLNKRVYWFENPQRVAVSKVPAKTEDGKSGHAGGDSIQFVIDEPKYTINGREYQMDTSARLIDGKAYVPLRVIGEFLNYKVTWQE